MQAFAVWPSVGLSSAVIPVSVMGCYSTARRATRAILPVKATRAATVALSFWLSAAAPVHAQGQPERLIPPLPVPHVASTTAHRPTALSPRLPRPPPPSAELS